MTENDYSEEKKELIANNLVSRRIGSVIFNNMKVESNGFINYKFYKRKTPILRQGERIFIEIKYPPRNFNKQWKNRTINNYILNGYVLSDRDRITDNAVNFNLTKSMFDTLGKQNPDLRAGEILQFSLNPKIYTFKDAKGKEFNHCYYSIVQIDRKEIPLEEKNIETNKTYEKLDKSSNLDVDEIEVSDLI